MCEWWWCNLLSWTGIKQGSSWSEDDACGEQCHFMQIPLLLKRREDVRRGAEGGKVAGCSCW